MSATLWFTPWKPGPAADIAPGVNGQSDGKGRSGGSDGGTDGAAVVSVTEFTPHRPLTALGVTVEGIALRRIWQDLEGAVGLWLWVDPDPFRPRSGSISVWRTERDLHAFVGRRDHMRIVRSYRNRGSMRATTWQTDGFDMDATQEAARALLSGRSAWPA
ncbi:hypothetical protein JGS39_16585 [Streptomyces sp. P01-B04]|uniref:DUF3291 domain-containing protein n=1 Tax=Streptomyces poriferorum TaxID=2798799 RepID=A0ABY9ISK8_9ACTN|nr:MULTISPECIES: hypothetical protein [Streptomyces]MBW5250587.1 hypothetical protein [Streptomyces poriferorum]MBW5255717.1 hypothetical protein [Streptomyces poriferorum]MDP5312571.1 hypothetical protein [Streptomyces sp. Alt4]WLQ58400.1 hypothetical protein P8A19_24535 [Streptomyces sp. Alt2]